MNSSGPPLVDRYVSAAVAGVPSSQRADVAAELRASVSDAVEDLVREGLPRSEAETRALTELGDPAAFAEHFGGRPRHLIGPEYFGQYSQLLRLLLIVVLPTLGAVLLVVQGLAGTNPLEVMFSALAVMFQVGVQITFWVTLVFALLERSGTAPPPMDWTPDDLPEVVDRRIGLSDTVFSVAALTLLIWSLLWQRDHWLITSTDGTQVPALNPGAWSFWIPALLVILAASIVLSIVKYRVGHWTVALSAVNTVLNVAFAGIVLWLWTTDALVNPDVEAILPEGVPQLFGALPWVVVVISVFDTAEGWWNLRRSAV